MPATARAALLVDVHDVPREPVELTGGAGLSRVTAPTGAAAPARESGPSGAAEPVPEAAVGTVEVSGEPAPGVALLAATALGLAFTNGLTRRSVLLLGDLADAEPDRLLQAREHALRMAPTSAEPRRLAADLLERAAMVCERATSAPAAGAEVVSRTDARRAPSLVGTG